MSEVVPPRRRLAVKLLWASIGLLVLAIIGVVIFLETLDADVYRRKLEQELSNALGRQVSIGAMSFDVAMRPTLAVRDLRIANPAWASRPDFLSVSTGEARVDLEALLKGRVTVRSVRLNGIDLLLERNPQGEGNWVFGTPDSGSKPLDLPDFDDVTLADARIAWKRADGSAVQARIDSAQAAIVEGLPFDLRAQGSYEGHAVRLTAKSQASLQSAIARNPWRVAIGLDQQDASLAFDVRWPSIYSLEGIEIGVEAAGKRLDSWAGIVGRPLPGWGPYRLSGQSRFSPGKFEADGLKLSLDGLPTHPPLLEIDSGRVAFGSGTDTQLSAAGRIGETAVSLEASGAAWPQPAPAAPLKLRAALADFALSAEGRIGGVDDSAFDLALHAEGDVMAALRTLAGVRSAHALPIDLATQVTRANQTYEAKAIKGQVLGVPVTGHLDYRHAPQARLAGALALGQLNLAHPAIRSLETANVATAGAASPRSGAPAWLDAVETDLTLRIASIAGLPFPARDLAARLQWRNDALQLQQIAATLSGTRLTGDGTLRWRDGRAQVEGKASVALLDLGKLGSGPAPRGSPGALDRPLPLAPLRALDADLRIDLGRVAGAPVTIEKVAATARLQGGKLAIDVASGTVAAVPLQGRVAIDATGNAWRVDVDAQAARIDLATLARGAKQPATMTGTLLETRAVLGSHGTNGRELLNQASLSVRTSPFTLAVPRDRFTLAVDRASIDVEPGGPVRVSAAGKTSGAAMDLTMTGGPLVELAEPASAWPRIEASMRSTLNGQLLQVDASSGPLQRLVGMRDVPLNLRVTAPGASATLEGTVRNLAAPMATPLSARVDIADLARTAALFTAARLPPLKVQATGRVTLGDGELSVAGLAAQVGRSDAAGQLLIHWRDRPRFTANLTSRLIDATQWAPEAVKEEKPLLDRPIPVAELLASDVQLRLRAQRFLLHKYDLMNLQLNGTLDKGLVQMQAHAAEGDMNGELRFDIRRVPGLAVRLQLKEVDSRSLYTGGTAPTSAAAPKISMRAQVAGTGATLRRMLATSDGAFLLTAGAGTLPIHTGYGFERIAGNLLLTLVPGRRSSDFNQLQCAAAHFTIAKGVATSSDGIVLRLQSMDILGSGAANLTTGQILFGYRAVRRSFFSLSLLGLTSGVAKVTGTLSNPTVELDPSGILLAGTAAWATAGVSLLAGELWRKLEATGDPCSRIASGAQLPDDPLEKLLQRLMR
ncbi:AsmA family protein [Variovorax sp. J22P168]|uniref:AsmA family protein n=1 Tax=Variovorax jilinensis TaxID=3053513 RepID=UPI002578A893|nr:AsmA family protein [Variovorax sp. J22P168]MDM0014932.1 AsmA family protein [Variovorax sp. J22P168]